MDASVARNFGILGWASHLQILSGGLIEVAHGILGIDTSEPGELDGIRSAIEAEANQFPGGSHDNTKLLVAASNLDALISLRSSGLSVVIPDAIETSLSLRLIDPAERDWRSGLGMKARKLDAGEAVSVAIASNRGLGFASDDNEARIAYSALGGNDHRWTLDLFKEAVTQGIVSEAEAKSKYESLIQEFNFWGAEWV